jgi:hypothetical protein
MESDTELIDSSLKESIAEAVHEYAREKQLEGVKSLSRYNPQKVGLILYLFSQGVSQTQMVRKYNLSHRTIKHTIIEYADHVGKWAEVGSKLAKRMFLKLSCLHDDVLDNIQRQFDEGKYKPVIKDIMYLSIAIEKTWQQSERARERIETAPEPRMVSQKDYDDTIAAAKERILALSAWSKRNPGATYEDAKKLFGKGDKLFANKD